MSDTYAKNRTSVSEKDQGADMILAQEEPKSRNHPFKVPGFFTLASGATVYIEEEFDYSEEMDQADAEYEEHMEMYNNQDYTYPGAFRDPEYLRKRESWDRFVEQKDAVWKDYSDRIENLGYDEDSLKLREELRKEREMVVEELMKQAPEKPQYERAKQPVHRFANRIFRIDLDERIIEYRQDNGKRGRALIGDLAEITPFGKTKILETPVRLFDFLPWETHVPLQVWLHSNIYSGYREAPKVGPFPSIREDDIRIPPTVRRVKNWDPSSDFQVYQRMLAEEGANHYSVLNQVITDYYLREDLSKNNVPPFDVPFNKMENRKPVESADVWVEYKKKVIQDWEEQKKMILEVASVIKDLFDRGTLKRSTFKDWSSYHRYDGFGVPAFVLGRIKPALSKIRREVHQKKSFLSGGNRHLETRGKEGHALDIVDNSNIGGKYNDPPPKLGFNVQNLILQEGDKYEEYKEEIIEQSNRFHETGFGDMPMVPHLHEDISLMPHQAVATAKINTVDRAIVDCDMGAGKTSIAFCDAMLALKEGKAKRPCVVMPGNTIPQQVDELMHKFGRNVNIIGLTNKSFRKYGKGQKGYDALKTQILEAPPNTIVLVAYEWLGQRPRLIGTGTFKKSGKERKAKDYWRGRFLTDECKIDMVSLDECHRIKNPETARAKSTYGMSAAKVKRVASGTMFPNTPDDIVGPMQFMDPMVFGDKKKFAEKYKLGLVRGKVTSIPPRTLKKIREDLSDYGMISMRRTAWMYMMPERKEKVHTCKLPPRLQDLYESLYNATIDSILSDPTLSQAWSKFQEDVGADDLELGGEGGGLLQILGQLDQFVTAPDTPIGGDIASIVDEYDKMEEGEDKEKLSKKLSRLQTVMKVRSIISSLPDEEKISPKCRKAAEIISGHLSDPSNKMIDKKTGEEYQGKVLVFVSNVGAAKHFKKYLPKLVPGLSQEEIAFYKADSKGRRQLDIFKDKQSKVKVLSAVDWSLREGHNLQMANRLIRADLKWSPGDMEQTYGRVYRPGADASTVHIDILVTENTLEVAKYGRLLSKYDAMRRVNSDFDDSAEEPLEPIRMNQTNIEKYEKVAQLGEYIKRYQDAADHDMEEAKRKADLYGNKYAEVAGGELPGAGRIAGRLPYYDPEDIYQPLRARVIEGKRGKPARMIIDDDESLDFLTKKDAKKLGFRYHDPGTGGYFRRKKVPDDLGVWMDKARSLGYHPSVTTLDADIPPITKQMVDQANRPDAEKEEKVRSVPSRNRSTEWETVATFDTDQGTYSLYRKPTEKDDGSNTNQYVLSFHEDKEIGNPASGVSLANFYASTLEEGQIGKVPSKAWPRINQRIIKHNDSITEVSWSESKSDLDELPSPTPEVKDTAPPPIEKELKEKTEDVPPNTIRSLRFLCYDGIRYLTVDADDDDANDLRQYGLVWFNSFYQRPFKTAKDARRIIMLLRRTGLEVENEEEFFEHARDAIWKRKVPQRKLLREQLMTMRTRRRDLTKGSISIHYLQFEGEHHIAVNALENQADLAKVRSVSQFNFITASYWKPAPDRNTVRKFVRKLYEAGYRVAYWDDFVKQSQKWYSYRPKFDLSVPEDIRSKIPKPPETPTKSTKKPTDKTKRRAPKGKKLSKNKLKTLQALADGQSSLDYSGRGDFNIAVIQALINKGYMVGEKDKPSKAYTGCSLTEKGYKALGLEMPPESAEEEAEQENQGSEPEEVVDLQETPGEDAESPVAPERDNDPGDGLDTLDVPESLPDTEEDAEEVFEDLGVEVEEVEKEILNDLSQAVEEATGPSWKLSRNDLDDEFSPEVRWSGVKGGYPQQIRILKDDNTWVMRRLRKKDGKTQSKTTEFPDALSAIIKAAQIMGGKSPDPTPEETEDQGGQGDQDFDSVTKTDFDAKVVGRTNSGSTIKFDTSIPAHEYANVTSKLSNKKSDDPRPRFQPIVIFEKSDGSLSWLGYGNTTVNPNRAYKDYTDRGQRWAETVVPNHSRNKLIMVPVDMTKARQ